MNPIAFIEGTGAARSGVLGALATTRWSLNGQPVPLRLATSGPYGPSTPISPAQPPVRERTSGAPEALIGRGELRVRRRVGLLVSALDVTEGL